MSDLKTAFSLYESCKKIVIDVGEIVESSKRTDFKIIRKSARELVTEIDLRAQKHINDAVKSLCDCPIFFEEDKTDGQIKLPAECFIVDPIDATHNLVAGLPFYNVSIGYIKNNEIVFGVVYFPYSREIYHAFKGKGAFKGSEKITVSDNSSLEKSIVAYDNQFHLDERTMENYQKLVPAVFTTRILGSANRDACFVAEGTLDARVWNTTKMYDIVAGAILVEEAGGVASDFKGEPISVLEAKEVVMSNDGIHKELLDLFAD